ncbi:hypothetical protein [Roseimicrobium sp. ORNL1]|uniref:hypothetical protein n=1 Tax=Roseimicrobium sp. ORNL1 TaxID=2711231 RepID=UPI0013E1AD7C|nr:hypothetical protein [Roseimicrobium sp. ORNL1]QIF01115.1 hypothetical protein G5S37_06145 [Roseimicrobium sp. ORNL1]
MTPALKMPSRLLRLGIAVILLLACSCGFFTASAHQEVQFVLRKVDIQDLTLREALDYLRNASRKLWYDDTPINVVLDTSRLTPAQLTSKITLQGEDMTFREIFHAISKGLGIGYRMDDYACFISSRAYAGLPQPPSGRAALVQDRAVKAYVLIIGKPKADF